MTGTSSTLSGVGQGLAEDAYHHEHSPLEYDTEFDRRQSNSGLLRFCRRTLSARANTAASRRDSTGLDQDLPNRRATSLRTTSDKYTTASPAAASASTARRRYPLPRRQTEIDLRQPHTTIAQGSRDVFSDEPASSPCLGMIDSHDRGYTDPVRAARPWDPWSNAPDTDDEDSDSVQPLTISFDDFINSYSVPRRACSDSHPILPAVTDEPVYYESDTVTGVAVGNTFDGSERIASPGYNASGGYVSAPEAHYDHENDGEDDDQRVSRGMLTRQESMALSAKLTALFTDPHPSPRSRSVDRTYGVRHDVYAHASATETHLHAYSQPSRATPHEAAPHSAPTYPRGRRRLETAAEAVQRAAAEADAQRKCNSARIGPTHRKMPSDSRFQALLDRGKLVESVTVHDSADDSAPGAATCADMPPYPSSSDGECATRCSHHMAGRIHFEDDPPRCTSAHRGPVGDDARLTVDDERIASEPSSSTTAGLQSALSGASGAALRAESTIGSGDGPKAGSGGATGSLVDLSLELDEMMSADLNAEPESYASPRSWRDSSSSRTFRPRHHEPRALSSIGRQHCLPQRELSDIIDRANENPRSFDRQIYESATKSFRYVEGRDSAGSPWELGVSSSINSETGVRADDVDVDDPDDRDVPMSPGASVDADELSADGATMRITAKRQSQTPVRRNSPDTSPPRSPNAAAMRVADVHRVAGDTGRRSWQALRQSSSSSSPSSGEAGWGAARNWPASHSPETTQRNGQQQQRQYSRPPASRISFKAFSAAIPTGRGKRATVALGNTAR